MNVKKQVDEITELREKIDRLKAERDRIAGQVEAHNAALEKLKTECKQRFGLEIEQIEDAIKEKAAEYEKLINQVRGILACQS